MFILTILFIASTLTTFGLGYLIYSGLKNTDVKSYGTQNI